MAEFSELMRIKKRLCIKYKSSGCIECPLNYSIGDLCGIISISGYSDNKFMELEEALLSWAAEHPEPVYPTWFEYIWKFAFKEPVSDLDLVIWMANNRIPADIAQKLGVEPKGG